MALAIYGVKIAYKTYKLFLELNKSGFTTAWIWKAPVFMVFDA